MNMFSAISVVYHGGIINEYSPKCQRKLPASKNTLVRLDI